MPTPKQYADALSATPRNSWKYLADAMQPVSEFADEFKVKQDVPLIGGMSAADFAKMPDWKQSGVKRKCRLF